MSEPDKLLGENLSPRLMKLKEKVEAEEIQNFHRTSKFSGIKTVMLTMKVPQKLHQDIKARALKLNLGISDWCRRVLQKQINEHAKEKKMEDWKGEARDSFTSSEQEALDVQKRVPPLPKRKQKPTL